ncbi:MAG: hypothetical protein GKC10_08045 [Methanosarcinales archaeon]|nr:hypothetical protein [Methanosarcinales archaeon]
MNSRIAAFMALSGLALILFLASVTALDYDSTSSYGQAGQGTTGFSPGLERDGARLNQPPTLISFVPDRMFSARPGSTVVFAAQASDQDGDRVLYQFWLNGPATGNIWKAMTNWTEVGIWNWTTTAADAGNNILEVRVRDGRHADADRWDDLLTLEYFIEEGTAGRTPTIAGFEPDRQSPQPHGTRIVWTATAFDPDGDTVLYQYWLKGTSTDDLWKAKSPWTTSPVWTFDSSQYQPGIYMVEVRIRDGYHAGADGWDDFKRASYVIRQFVK